jgi:hypothetical protein
MGFVIFNRIIQAGHFLMSEGQRMPVASTAFLTENLSFERKTRVMDIGSNPTHAQPYADLLAAGFCELHGFEPQQAAYEKLVANRQDFEVHHPYAVGRSRKPFFTFATATPFPRSINQATNTSGILGIGNTP